MRCDLKLDNLLLKFLQFQMNLEISAKGHLSTRRGEKKEKIVLKSRKDRISHHAPHSSTKKFTFYTGRPLPQRLLSASISLSSPHSYMSLFLFIPRLALRNERIKCSSVFRKKITAPVRNPGTHKAQSSSSSTKESSSFLYGELSLLKTHLRIRSVFNQGSARKPIKMLSHVLDGKTLSSRSLQSNTIDSSLIVSDVTVSVWPSASIDICEKRPNTKRPNRTDTCLYIFARITALIYEKANYYWCWWGSNLMSLHMWYIWKLSHFY